MRIRRTITVDRPVAVVFGFLSDFTTTTQWDPGTVETVRVSGDGGVGTAYRNTSRFLGRTTELTYVVTELRPNERFALRGENTTVVAHDSMEFGATPAGGTAVTYTAEFDFRGVARFLAPLLAPAVKRLGDNAEKGLYRSLRAL